MTMPKANRRNRTPNLFSILAGDALDAARALVGARIVRRLCTGEKKSARIIEVEAYHESEPGSHCFRRRTPRNAVMFARAGIAYVYFTYGMYHCLNVVAGKEGEGAAVLLRAAEFIPLQTDWKGSGNGALSGPGKLSRELDITREQNEINLLNRKNGELWLLGRASGDVPEIAATTRIGISVQEALPWRFVEVGNPRLSRRYKQQSLMET